MTALLLSLNLPQNRILKGDTQQKLTHSNDTSYIVKQFSTFLLSMRSRFFPPDVYGTALCIEQRIWPFCFQTFTEYKIQSMIRGHLTNQVGPITGQIDSL